MHKHDLRHIVESAPRVLVVDGSKLVRRLVGDVLRKALPEVDVVDCAGLEDARDMLAKAPVALAITALSLPDGDGLALARLVREGAGQSYVPVIVVSGEAQSRLEDRSMGEDVTDYFDKSLGHAALATFIRGYVRPEPVPGARVLYVEDSRVVAVATSRMLRAQGMEVTHVLSVEEAIEHLKTMQAGQAPMVDLVLTDLYLKGELDGRDLLSFVRRELKFGKRRMPVLVMTGDENPDKQSELLRAGANDLVVKPIEERLLVTKTLFQLRIARMEGK